MLCRELTAAAVYLRFHPQPKLTGELAAAHMTGKLPDADEEQPRRNREFVWSQFEPEAYFEHYYGDPHPDDGRVTACAARALMQALPRGEGLTVVDVGTGPNLIPFLSALPRAKSLTAWEYSQANLDWLRDELARPQLRPQWQYFWQQVCAVYEQEHAALPGDPLAQLKAKAELLQGSIFDLPAGRWDAASMFFCAESITERRDEFESACASFARCVKPGGTLAAAFLVGSGGYEVAGRRFPAIRLSPPEIEAVFRRLCRHVEIEPIGVVDQEIRSGYSGALFLHGET